jgi:hypothetical protein
VKRRVNECEILIYYFFASFRFFSSAHIFLEIRMAIVTIYLAQIYCRSFFLLHALLSFADAADDDDNDFLKN